MIIGKDHTKSLHPRLRIYFFLVGLADSLHFDLTDKCYTLSKVITSWDDARKACQGTPWAKSDLATVADQETMDFIEKNFKISSNTWIGGEKVSEEWSWADGTAWNFTNWEYSEPDNDDALYLKSDYLWYDYRKYGTYHYICQYSL